VTTILIGKRERNRPLGRPRRRWDDNIEMDLAGIGCEGIGWIQLGKNMFSGRLLCTRKK
jgi:hypothetical protein